MTVPTDLAPILATLVKRLKHGLARHVRRVKRTVVRIEVTTKAKGSRRPRPRISSVK